MVNNSEEDQSVEVPPTQQKSETPRTDENITECRCGECGGWEYVDPDFARKLERELNDREAKLLEMANEMLRLKRKLSRLEGMK